MTVSVSVSVNVSVCTHIKIGGCCTIQGDAPSTVNNQQQPREDATDKPQKHRIAMHPPHSTPPPAPITHAQHNRILLVVSKDRAL